MIKLNKFLMPVLTCIYAAFLFYLSSLSSPPCPHDPGLLSTFLTLLRDAGLEFLAYPLYPVYKYTDKVAHVMLYMGLGLLLNPTLNASSNVLKKTCSISISFCRYALRHI